MLTILIAGGTGLIGTRLSKLLSDLNHKVIHLSRSENLNKTFPAYQWNIEQGTIAKAAIEQADYVINLAGAGIADERWTAKRKQLIIDSRVNSTLLLKKSIEQYKPDLTAYLAASAIGFYGDRGEETLDENSGAGKSGFLAKSVIAWESAINRIMETSIRTVALRIGLVLSYNGGALPKLMLPAKIGVGGYFGKGDQWYSWVHIDDVCRLFIHAIENDKMKGFYNATAPNPERNKPFTKIVGKAMGKNLLMIPGAKAAMRIGLGEMADTILGSAKVLPTRTLNSGFEFQYPELLPALRHIMKEKV